MTKDARQPRKFQRWDLVTVTRLSDWSSHSVAIGDYGVVIHDVGTRIPLYIVEVQTKDGEKFEYCLQGDLAFRYFQEDYVYSICPKEGDA